MRANSYVRMIEILDFCLLKSKEVRRRRASFFIINSNQFTKEPSRKIFRTYIKELLDEKLLVRINSSNKRSKYYSITPLGVIHLMRIKLVGRGKYTRSELKSIILILQKFAQQNVKPYNSIIFGKEKFFGNGTDFFNDLEKWWPYSYMKPAGYLFSDVVLRLENTKSEYPKDFLEFFILNGYYRGNKIWLADFYMKENVVNVDELKPAIYGSNSTFYPKSTELRLDDEQFHHYLANLILCSLIYLSAMMWYDLLGMQVQRFNIEDMGMSFPNMYKEFNNKMKDSPEYFLRILVLFSKHILYYTKSQYELTTNFKDKLNKIQFIKN